MIAPSKQEIGRGHARIQEIIRTGGDPRKIPDTELLKIRNLGPGTLRAIRFLTGGDGMTCWHCGVAVGRRLSNWEAMVLREAKAKRLRIARRAGGG